MQTLTIILGILLGGETLAFISFFIYLKLNKREKTTQVEAQETQTMTEQLDLVDRYRQKVLELEKERDEYWKSNYEDMHWIKDTLSHIVQYLNGNYQDFLKSKGYQE